MYQAVYFDAFNTLFGTRWAKDSQARRLPLQQTIKQAVHEFDAHLQAAYGRAHAGEQAEAGCPTRLFAAFADRSGLARTGPLALLRRKEENVRRWFKVYSDAVSTLQTLSEVCKLGIISNAWPYLESLLNLLGLWPYFESVIISAQVGLSKPNPAIYELALRTLGIPADKAIFVDDIPQNVAAAERVGLKGLWLTRQAVSEPPAPYRHLAQIYSLRDIIPVALGV
jgi:HAD superfamily hydrolase (TIGR01509 family)